jgi:hypothetical protein
MTTKKPVSRRYGADHRALRAKLKPWVELGGMSCTRCNKPIRPGERWHLDHADTGNPSDYAGAAHARCNASAGGRRGAAKTNARRVAELDPRRNRERVPTAADGVPPGVTPRWVESRDIDDGHWARPSRAW